MSQTNQYKFVYADQPDIYHQHQKDQNIFNLLKQRILDGIELFIPKFFSYRQLANNIDLINLASLFAYNFLTSYSEKKTLGEEFTSIRQYNANDFTNAGKPVKNSRKLIFFVLSTFAQFGLIKLCKKKFQRLRENAIFSQDVNPSFFYHLKQAILRNMPDFDQLLQQFFKVNLVLFFMDGRFYQFSKRLTSIQLIQVKQPKENPIKYNRIGLLMLAQITFQLVDFVWSVAKESVTYHKKSLQKIEENKQSEEIQQQKEDSSQMQQISQKTCGLCFENIVDASVTSCGHLFCWNCIIKSAQIKSECPVCRSQVLPKQVIQLKNYY